MQNIQRASLHRGGRPQVGKGTPLGEVTRLSICKPDRIKRRNYTDEWVTSPTWVPPPPCKQALSFDFMAPV